MLFDDEEFIATLTHDDEYRYHPGQVANLTNKQIGIVKRHWSLFPTYGIEKIAMRNCIGIEYRNQRPVWRMAAGALLLCLLGFIFYMLWSYWDSVASGTHIHIGLLGLAVMAGVRWTFQARHHKILFLMNDHSRLVWQSRPGDFQAKQVVVQRVLAFARSAGLLSAQMARDSSMLS